MFIFKLAVIIVIILKYDREEPLKCHACIYKVYKNNRKQ